MQTALAVADVMADARLADTGGDRVTDQLLMPLQPGLAMVNQRNAFAIVVDQGIVDAGDRADAAGCRPGAAREPIGRGNALAALDQWPDFTAR